MEAFIASLESIVWHNINLWQLTLAIGAFFVSLLVLKLFQIGVIARLKRMATATENRFDDALIDMFSHVRTMFYIVVSLYIGLLFLPLPAWGETAADVVLWLVLADAIIHAVSVLMQYGTSSYLNHTDKDQDAADDPHNLAMMRVMRGVISFSLWVVVLIFVLSNLGIDVTSVVASLGIGGLAVALALQNVLGDIFSSFSIYIDKPFEVGDFIQVGQEKGVVEKIGLKTTRIIAPRGEEIVISNKELTSARVQNFKKLHRRRDVVQFGVVYGLTQTKLKEVTKLVKAAVTKQERAKFDRCHLTNFGGSSLDYELVYYIDSDDYTIFMNTRQAILLGIYTAFNKAGIEFAYPTQVVYLEKG